MRQSLLRETQMELPSALRLSFEDNPSAQDRKAVEEALGAYNAPFLRNPPYSYFGIFIRDEANAIRAGLIGNCYAGWLFVALLWVHADLRRIGIGSRLMAEAERHGREFGCHSAFVDTFTFQGPEFYPKLGYHEYARLDYPPDHHRIFFCKNLDINIVKVPSHNSDERESLS